mmetsp:Transcript_2557/g.4380  ORF Transcript_2557/g.4380 Transcript_2557/m.4380 type:complete len:266 (-) Transcript_2557:153-950(-)
MAACNESLDIAPGDVLQGTKIRKMLADYSADIGLTARYNAVLPTSAFGCGFNFTASPKKSNDVNIPRKLKIVYGAYSHRLAFVVLLREYLSRYQSAWYYSRQPYHARWPGAEGRSFWEDIEKATRLAKKGIVEMCLWNSLFGNLLQTWLRYFHGSQWFLAGYRQYTKVGTDEFCKEVGLHLGITVPCTAIRSGKAMSNAVIHPSLEKDLPQATRQALLNVIKGDKEMLLNMLLLAYSEGARLPAFRPADGIATKEKIQTWLHAGW